MKNRFLPALIPFLFALTTAPVGAQPAIETPALPTISSLTEDHGLVVPDAAVPSSGGVIGGASLYYLKPYFNNNTALTTVTGVGTPNPFRTDENFTWNYNACPAVWLGWVSESGLGVRGRFFDFDQSSNSLSASRSPSNTGEVIAAPSGLALTGPLNNPAGAGGAAVFGPAFGSPGIIMGAGFGQDQLTFNSNLKINVVDVEATQDWQTGQLWLQVSGGGRYLHSSQDYTATLLNQADVGGGATASESQRLQLGHNFNGGGITTALSVRRFLGDTGMALYGSVRGSMLVGISHENLSFTQIIVDPTGVVGGNQNNIQGGTNSKDTLLPVTELEAGVEYTYRAGKLNPFFRVAAVDQTYYNLGSSTQTAGNLTLFGVQFTAGLNY